MMLAGLLMAALCGRGQAHCPDAVKFGLTVFLTALRRGQAPGLDAKECLIRADSGRLWQLANSLSTGPTGTNVMGLMPGLRA